MFPKDIQHFIHKCSFFSDQRVSLLEKITNILRGKDINIQNIDLRKICLYDHTELSHDANKSIMKTTIRFILESNRFS
jgi:hypothetical protein